MNASKKRSLLIAFFLMILQIPGTHAQYSAGLTFNDPQGRFSLLLGPGWTQLQIQTQGELAHYAYAQGGIAAAELSIASESLPMILTPEQYAQAVEQNVLASLPQYQKLQMNVVNLGGQQACYYRFSILKQTQIGQIQVIVEQYFLVMQNTGVTITFMILPNQFDSIKPALDQVVQSFQTGARAAQTIPQYPAQTPYGQPSNVTYPQTTQQDFNTLLQQYQQQQQQIMQQYMQMYGQNPYNVNSYNPTGMPDTTNFFNQAIAQQMQMATLTPPPLSPSPQAQMLINPQTIPTYPMANQTGQSGSNLPSTHPMQPTTQTTPATGNIYGPMPQATGPTFPQGHAVPPVQPLQNPPTAGPTLQSYQDPQGRFAILIPESFKKDETSAGTAFKGPQGQEIQIVEISYSEEFLNALLKDKTLLERKDVEVEAGIQKVRGTWFSFQGSNPQTGQGFITTGLVVHTKNLFFAFATPQNQFPADKEVVDRVLKSVDVHG